MTETVDSTKTSGHHVTQTNSFTVKEKYGRDDVIEFAKRVNSRSKHDDFEITSATGPYFGGRVYCVEWGFDEERDDYEYYCYIFAHDGRELTYSDNSDSLLSELSRLNHESVVAAIYNDKQQYSQRLMNYASAVIAIMVTLAVLALSFLGTESVPDQLWSIFSLIIGFYFGRTIGRSVETPTMGK